MACCGINAGITYDSITDDIHSYSISIDGNPIDVTTFDSVGDAGDWLTCRQNASLVVNTYAYITGVEKGDTGIVWSANVCGTTISGTCTCTNISVPVDVSSPPTITYTNRITGDITGI